MKRQQKPSLSDINQVISGPQQKLLKQYQDSVPGYDQMSHDDSQNQTSQFYNPQTTTSQYANQANNNALTDVIECMGQAKENLENFLLKIGDLQHQKLTTDEVKSLLRIKFEPLTTYDKFRELYETDIQKMISSKSIKKNWNQDDILLLIWIAQKYCQYNNISLKQISDQNWSEISDLVPGKSMESCKFKWLQMCKIQINRIPWSKKENKVLSELVKKEGNNAWVEISKELFMRTGQKLFRSSKQCREHYNNFLDPSLKNTSWTFDEDKIIIEMQAKIGNKWSEIAKHLPGRTDNTVKNRFMSLRNRNQDSIDALKQYYSQKSIEDSQSQSKIISQKNLGQNDNNTITPSKQKASNPYGKSQNQNIFNQTQGKDEQYNEMNNFQNNNNGEMMYNEQENPKFEDNIYLESDDPEIGQNGNNLVQNTKQEDDGYKNTGMDIQGNYQQQGNNKYNGQYLQPPIKHQYEEEMSSNEQYEEIQDKVNDINGNYYNQSLKYVPDKETDTYLIKNLENMSINDNLKPAYINLETKEIFLVNPLPEYAPNSQGTNVSIELPTNQSYTNVPYNQYKKDFEIKVQNPPPARAQNNSKRSSIIRNNPTLDFNINHHPLEQILVGFPHQSMNSLLNISPTLRKRGSFNNMGGGQNNLAAQNNQKIIPKEENIEEQNPNMQSANNMFNTRFEQKRNSTLYELSNQYEESKEEDQQQQQQQQLNNNNQNGNQEQQQQPVQQQNMNIENSMMNTNQNTNGINNNGELVKNEGEKIKDMDLENNNNNFSNNQEQQNQGGQENFTQIINLNQQNTLMKQQSMNHSSSSSTPTNKNDNSPSNIQFNSIHQPNEHVGTGGIYSNRSSDFNRQFLNGISPPYNQRDSVRFSIDSQRFPPSTRGSLMTSQGPYKTTFQEERRRSSLLQLNNIFVDHFYNKQQNKVQQNKQDDSVSITSNQMQSNNQSQQLFQPYQQQQQQNNIQTPFVQQQQQQQQFPSMQQPVLNQNPQNTVQQQQPINNNLFVNQPTGLDFNQQQQQPIFTQQQQQSPFQTTGNQFPQLDQNFVQQQQQQQQQQQPVQMSFLNSSQQQGPQQFIGGEIDQQQQQ